MNALRIIDAGTLLRDVCHQAAVASGWHSDIKTGKPFNKKQRDALFGARIALCHSELSEALEGHRKGLKDDHLPYRPMVEVELADAVIRICDLAGAMGYDVGGAIADKLAYNAKRADHRPAERAKAGGKAY